MNAYVLRIQYRQDNPIYGRKWLVQISQSEEQWVTVGRKLSLVLGIREHWHWHMGSSKPRKQDLGTRPVDLYSGASWFLSTGSFSVLGTLPRSWKALVEKLMLALSSFGVCGLLQDCHWQEWLWPFKSLCKQTKAPMQIDKQNQRLH